MAYKNKKKNKRYVSELHRKMGYKTVKSLREKDRKAKATRQIKDLTQNELEIILHQQGLI